MIPYLLSYVPISVGEHQHHLLFVGLLILEIHVVAELGPVQIQNVVVHQKTVYQTALLVYLLFARLLLSGLFFLLLFVLHSRIFTY